MEKRRVIEKQNDVWATYFKYAGLDNVWWSTGKPVDIPKKDTEYKYTYIPFTLEK